MHGGSTHARRRPGPVTRSGEARPTSLFVSLSARFFFFFFPCIEGLKGLHAKMNMCVLYTVYRDSGAEECKNPTTGTQGRQDGRLIPLPPSLSLFCTHSLSLPLKNLTWVGSNHSSLSLSLSSLLFLLSSPFLSPSNPRTPPLFCVATRRGNCASTLARTSRAVHVRMCM